MASENFFRHTYREESSFFDEGPARLEDRKSQAPAGTFVNTSSIDTKEVDPYRQGIELTNVKHFDAGIVKIHAGEPGHVLRRNRFGMDKNFRNDPRFEELDYFSPQLFIKAQELASPLLFNILTFPIITSDNDQIENYIFDGVIEPFTIRARASFFSIEVPFESHEIKASLMGGNLDTTWASDQVTTVNEYAPGHQYIGFLDMVDMIDGRYPLNGYFRHDKPPLPPFVDARFPRNAPLATNYDTDLNAAVSIMSGSTDNYVPLKKLSSVSGWDYDSVSGVGTDSLAFGGMVY